MAADSGMSPVGVVRLVSARCVRMFERQHEHLSRWKTIESIEAVTQ